MTGEQIRPGTWVTTAEQIDSLPTGAVLARRGVTSHRWQRGTESGEEYGEGQWYGTHTGGYHLADELAGYSDMEVESVPDPLPGETAKQFAWRFRDIALSGAERAGSANRALPVLARMRLEFTPTPGLRIVSQHDRAYLPTGSRVYTGDPEVWDSFGVFEKAHSGIWVTLLAGPDAVNPDSALAVVVDQVLDKTEPDPWLVESATERDSDRISAFRAKAWNEGYKAKCEHSWCGEFERVMIRAGVSADSVNQVQLAGYRVGSVLTPDQVVRLPVGTILRTVNESEGFAYFERVERSTNRAGTRLVEGIGYTHHYADQMVIDSAVGPVGLDKNKAGEYRCTSVEFMNALPVGSVIGRHGHADRWRKERPFENRRRIWARLSEDEAHEPPLGRPGDHHSSAFHPGAACAFVVHRIGPSVKKEEG